ncbi:hypothetical protein BDW72DRAFT_182547 [Aspergillus terricola var. indicus]
MKQPCKALCWAIMWIRPVYFSQKGPIPMRHAPSSTRLYTWRVKLDSWTWCACFYVLGPTSGIFRTRVRQRVSTSDKREIQKSVDYCVMRKLKQYSSRGSTQTLLFPNVPQEYYVSCAQTYLSRSSSRRRNPKRDQHPPNSFSIRL